jgi:hypothetical protein
VAHCSLHGTKIDALHITITILPYALIVSCDWL